MSILSLLNLLNIFYHSIILLCKMYIFVQYCILKLFFTRIEISYLSYLFTYRMVTKPLLGLGLLYNFCPLFSVLLFPPPTSDSIQQRSSSIHFFLSLVFTSSSFRSKKNNGTSVFQTVPMCTFSQGFCLVFVLHILTVIFYLF